MKLLGLHPEWAVFRDTVRTWILRPGSGSAILAAIHRWPQYKNLARTIIFRISYTVCTCDASMCVYLFRQGGKID